MKKSTLLCSTVVLATAAFVSGCVVAPAPYRYHPAVVVYPDSPPATVVAYSAPPPPQVEVIGQPPVQGYIWISGVWLWEGGRHVWHSGHWNAPRPGYVWVPHRWHQEGNEWHMDGGHWNRY